MDVATQLDKLKKTNNPQLVNQLNELRGEIGRLQRNNPKQNDTEEGKALEELDNEIAKHLDGLGIIPNTPPPKNEPSGTTTNQAESPLLETSASHHGSHSESNEPHTDTGGMVDEQPPVVTHAPGNSEISYPTGSDFGVGDGNRSGSAFGTIFPTLPPSQFGNQTGFEGVAVTGTRITSPYVVSSSKFSTPLITGAPPKKDNVLTQENPEDTGMGGNALTKRKGDIYASNSDYIPGNIPYNSPFNPITSSEMDPNNDSVLSSAEFIPNADTAPNVIARADGLPSSTNISLPGWPVDAFKDLLKNANEAIAMVSTGVAYAGKDKEAVGASGTPEQSSTVPSARVFEVKPSLETIRWCSTLPPAKQNITPVCIATHNRRPAGTLSMPLVDPLIALRQNRTNPPPPRSM